MHVWKFPLFEINRSALLLAGGGGGRGAEPVVAATLTYVFGCITMARRPPDPLITLCITGTMCERALTATAAGWIIWELLYPSFLFSPLSLAPDTSGRLIRETNLVRASPHMHAVCLSVRACVCVQHHTYVTWAHAQSTVAVPTLCVCVCVHTQWCGGEPPRLLGKCPGIADALWVARLKSRDRDTERERERERVFLNLCASGDNCCAQPAFLQNQKRAVGACLCRATLQTTLQAPVDCPIDCRLDLSNRSPSPSSPPPTSTLRASTWCRMCI